MVKRLLIGLLVGALVGALVAAGLFALGATSFGGPLAYGSAALAGAVTGLVAGKPVWAAQGRIEGGLKAVFGAAIAVGLMFAVRKWLHVEVDLALVHAGRGVIGDVPGASLPVVAGVLGAVFGVDDTPDAKAKRVRVGDAAPSATVAESEEASESDEEESPKRAKRS